MILVIDPKPIAVVLKSAIFRLESFFFALGTRADDVFHRFLRTLGLTEAPLRRRPSTVPLRLVSAGVP
jgi:hypothetical protein